MSRPAVAPEDRAYWRAVAARQPPYRLSPALRPRTEGALVALLAALLEAPAEAFVVPLAWAPRGGMRALVARLHSHRRGADFRPVWRAILAAPDERAVAWWVVDAVRVLPGLVADGRSLLAAIRSAARAGARHARRARRRSAASGPPAVDPSPYVRLVRDDAAA